MLLKNISSNLKVNKKLMLITGILLIILIISILWISALLSSNKIYKGASIENLDVSGLTADQATVLLKSHLVSLYSNRTSLIKYEDNQWEIKPSDINLSYDTLEAVKVTYSLGREGGMFKRIYFIWELSKNKINIPVKFHFDNDKLLKLLDGVKTKFDTESKDALIEYKNNKINISKEVLGKSVDIEASARVFKNEIADKKFDNINLVVESISPEVVYDDIKDIESVLGYSLTSFNARDVNRTFNIKLACEKINGTIIKPGEVFSMNEALGPRTLENGYKDAKVIYKNELIDGPGGGVCQVTTTLYGSVLKAGAKIVERMHHSMPLGYVDPGQDATIAEDFIDFKFKNSKDYPIAIIAEATGNNLYIRLLGKKEDNDYIVKLKSVVIEEYSPEGEEIIVDNSIPDNEKRITREPKNGVKVKVYRELYNKNGQLLDKEKVSEDIYRPVKAQIKVNQNYFEAYYSTDMSLQKN